MKKPVLSPVQHSLLDQVANLTIQQLDGRVFRGCLSLISLQVSGQVVALAMPLVRCLVYSEGWSPSGMPGTMQLPPRKQKL